MPANATRASGEVSQLYHDPRLGSQNALGVHLLPSEQHGFTNVSDLLMDLDGYMWNDLERDQFIAVSSDVTANPSLHLQNAANLDTSSDASFTGANPHPRI
jgi:hypothetical protein